MQKSYRFLSILISVISALSLTFLSSTAFAAPKGLVNPEEVWSPEGSKALCTTVITNRGPRNVGVGPFGKNYMLATKLIERLLKRSNPKTLKKVKALRKTDKLCKRSIKPAPSPTATPTPTSPPVVSENQPPVANPLSLSVIEASEIDFTLTASDPEGDSLSFSIVSGPLKGDLSGTAPNFVYTRTSHFLGQDAIVFKVSDGRNESQATVTISTIPIAGDFAGKDSLIPYRDILSEAECRAFIKSVLMGGSGEVSVAECQTLGLSAFVDLYLSKDISSATWNQAFALAVDVNGRWNQTETRRFWNYIYVAAEDPLRMRLAHIMGDHFAASAALYYGSGSEHLYIRDYVTLLIHHAFNFETLVETFIGADRLMADWLNNNVNTRNGLNENFARELMELFTTRLNDQFTGLPNYTEDDVAELTKALSGFQKIYQGGTHYLFWSPQLWFDGVKNLFPGTSYQASGNFNYVDVAPILLYTHKGTARSVAYKLAAELTSPDISEELVGELAEDLRSSRFNLKEKFLPKLLKSSFMFKRDLNYSCIGSPIQQAVGFMRSTQLPLGLPSVGILDAMKDYEMSAGETPNEPRSVFGNMGCGVGGRTTVKAYGEVWVSSQQWLLERQRRTTDLLKSIRDLHTDAVYDRFIPKAGATGAEVVDNISKILGVKLSDQEKGILVSRYMNRKKTGSNSYVNFAFELLNPSEKRWKIAGALEILFGRHEQGNVL